MEDENQEIEELKKKIRALSEVYTTSMRDLALHFQALKSARAPRLLMDAPGLYYPRIPLFVISKGGASTGHRSLNDEIKPYLPEGKRLVYGFTLYPDSYVRSCMDRLLRKTVKTISPQVRVSMENVFNKKYHGRDFTDSPILKELVEVLKKDLVP